MPNFAYVDPSTGGLLVQIILAGLAGLGVIIKIYWKRVVALWGRITGRPKSNGNIGSRINNG